VILVLQLIMLAVTACTTPPEPNSETGSYRIIASTDLDRAERGEEGTPIDGSDQEPNLEEREARGDLGYEHVTIRVGIVDTIRELWESEARIIRRFR